MGRQFSIYLDESETRRLTEMAINECRRPQDQVRYILRSVLMNEPSRENNKPVTNTLPEQRVNGFGTINPS